MIFEWKNGLIWISINIEYEGKNTRIKGRKGSVPFFKQAWWVETKQKTTNPYKDPLSTSYSISEKEIGQNVI